MNHVEFTDDDQLPGFEKYVITQADDYEGAVVCTLIRMKSEKRNPTVILHIHGFNDYFFHAHIAKTFFNQGIDFYGVDLGKSGRSLLPHQKMNNLRDVEEYFDDIEKGLQLIRGEHSGFVILEGHSLGGLVCALFAASGRYDSLFDGLFLNSPFFEQNKDAITRKLLIPLVSQVAEKYPNLRVVGGFSKFYGPSLHHSEHGLWEYNLKWKPHIAPLVNAGWVKAIFMAQKTLKSGIAIKQPVLLAYPSRSYRHLWWDSRFLKSDAVVNVKHIRKHASSLRGQISIHEVDDAVHDLFLSSAAVRERAIGLMLDWIRNTF